MKHIHEMDMAHLDIKPANIMLVKGQQKGEFIVKIADFGIAKAFVS